MCLRSCLDACVCVCFIWYSIEKAYMDFYTYLQRCVSLIHKDQNLFISLFQDAKTEKNEQLYDFCVY